MLVLGIESSCDETAAAIVRDGREMVSSVISSQVEIHSRFGVVVPELASREHLDKIVPVVEEAFARNGDPRAVRFSVPRMGDGRPDFSFSGLKTAVSKHVRETGLKPVAPGEEPSQAVKDLAASFQDVVIRSLVGTTEKLAAEHRPRTLIVAGGVACNSALREASAAADESTTDYKEIAECGIRIADLTTVSNPQSEFRTPQSSESRTASRRAREPCGFFLPVRRRTPAKGSTTTSGKLDFLSARGRQRLTEASVPPACSPMTMRRANLSGFAASSSTVTVSPTCSSLKATRLPLSVTCVSAASVAITCSTPVRATTEMCRSLTSTTFASTRRTSVSSPSPLAASAGTYTAADSRTAIKHARLRLLISRLPNPNE
ncbi:MAG: hypothetical protein DMF67_01145 [Acidobacteria bacterium]|nr:MAG: hypothetical protein DMF67_01145 [Acidobacteriota bacterium]